jgi:hypothetical protein
MVKEDMEVDFKRKKQISRIQAATKRLERKVKKFKILFKQKVCIS